MKPRAYSSSSSDDDYPDPLTVMRQDLVAAGWQEAMSKKWDADPGRVLKRMNKRWANDEDVKTIMREQNTEVGYAQ